MVNSFKVHDPSFWTFEDWRLGAALDDLAQRDEIILARVDSLEAKMLAKIAALESEVARLRDELADKRALAQDRKRGRGTSSRNYAPIPLEGNNG